MAFGYGERRLQRGGMPLLLLLLWWPGFPLSGA
jgi:hypothetical protein